MPVSSDECKMIAKLSVIQERKSQKESSTVTDKPKLFAIISLHERFSVK